MAASFLWRPADPDPGQQERAPGGHPQPTFCIFMVSVKCHSLVIELHMDCVTGLKNPLNLEVNWRRSKPGWQQGSEGKKGSCRKLGT